jgi:hypothetical protein
MCFSCPHWDRIRLLLSPGSSVPVSGWACHGKTYQHSKPIGIIMAPVLLLLFQIVLASNTEVTTGHLSAGPAVAARKILGLRRAARHDQTPPRQPQQPSSATTVAPDDLQQALQRMLAVPIATPQSVLAAGHKGLDSAALRNWHLLARKLAAPGSNITLVAFGGSLTLGYGKYPEAWRDFMQGSWVEQLQRWLQVGPHISTIIHTRCQRTVCMQLEV